MKIKQLEQITTFEYNYSSSQLAKFLPLLRAYWDHSTPQPWQLFRSVLHPVGNFFERMQNWCAIFLLLSIGQHLETKSKTRIVF